MVKLAREPVINAPVAAVTVGVTILAGYFLQSLRIGAQDLPYWAASAANLASGRYETLLTALLLHDSWTQALMNAVMGVAFATPVARLLGSGTRGVIIFALYYTVCGALANFGVLLLHPNSTFIVIGTSGAISGLAAGAARIVSGQGQVGPILSPFVIGLGAAWVILNLLAAVLAASQGAVGEIPWEAPLIGFLAGLILIPLANFMTAPKV